MKLEKLLSDQLTVEFSSAEPEILLGNLIQGIIEISHITQVNELTYQIQIYRKDYKKLSDILKKHGANPKILNKMGLYWTSKNLFRRPLLLSMFLFIVLSSLYLPSRILFVTVEGAEVIPESMILQAAENCGIRFGASRKFVRSEKMKNALLSEVPGLQWAGINTSGCTAIISVRESNEKNTEKANVISNIIANRDGYVLETTITNGTSQITPGDTVTKGQLLISGYTDCGICIRTCRAEGEILAQTQRIIQVVMPKNHYVSVSKEKPYYGLSCLLGKKRINLWKDSRISSTGYDRMYEEYYVSLPGGFQLPFAICVDQYFLHDLQPQVVAEKDALIQMQEFSSNYLKQDMIGGQILQSQHHFQCDEGLYYLQSSYTCTEMIGKERRDEIGVMNGKRY